MFSQFVKYLLKIEITLNKIVQHPEAKSTQE